MFRENGNDLVKPCKYCGADPLEECWDDPHPKNFFKVKVSSSFWKKVQKTFELWFANQMDI